MKWVEERPVINGWYWCGEPGDDIIMLEITGNWAVSNDGIGYDTRTDFRRGTKWCGPLTPPK
jgi:hypothetical protein